MMREEDVLEALRNIIDPDFNKDIVSLGFVKNIRILGDEVSLEIQLTTPACPVKNEFQRQAEYLVRQLPGIKKVSVQMTAAQRPFTSALQGIQSTLNTVASIIAVSSCKGGVGKSTVACNLALSLAKTGATLGLLDADIYGPSLPMMLGITDRPQVRDGKVIPIDKYGMKVMSMGLLMGEDTPVIWRGPMVAGIIQQFLGQVEWGELDYLIVDLPPGTGDAQLTLTQQAPLSGAVIVTTPQDVALLDARKGLRMFQEVKVPVLGIVENMSYFICDQCFKKHTIFKQGGGKKVADELKLPLLESLPIDPNVVIGGDSGKPVVISQPDSEVARSYAKLAGRVAQELSILSSKKPAELPSFQMQWK